MEGRGKGGGVADPVLLALATLVEGCVKWEKGRGEGGGGRGGGG